MPAKTKQPQAQNLEEAQNRDLFQTPNYATDLLVPFIENIIPHTRKSKIKVWECAAGLRKMSSRLEHFGFDVISTDIQYENPFNFLTDKPDFDFDIIVTNTPFSLKKKFYERCLFYNKPFALLMPADYSLWLMEAVKKEDCEKIIPERRIDYITPNTLYRIWEGESWIKRGITTCTLVEWKKAHTKQELMDLLEKGLEFKYESIYEVPVKLLRKYSSSDFHSMWLTRYLNLGRTETFVELTNEMKNNI